MLLFDLGHHTEFFKTHNSTSTQWDIPEYPDIDQWVGAVRRMACIFNEQEHFLSDTNNNIQENNLAIQENNHNNTATLKPNDRIYILIAHSHSPGPIIFQSLPSKHLSFFITGSIPHE